MGSFNRYFIVVVILFSCLIYVINGKSYQNIIEKTVKILRDKRHTTGHSDNDGDSDSGGGGDEYVMEDMSLIQNDQPSLQHSRLKHSQQLFGHIQNEAPEPEPKKRMSSLPGNVQFTKEILIKQGRLKGYVRIMHPQTGLKNVRQYLGIPYAAAPIGNGRFMPPGLYRYFFLSSKKKIQISNSLTVTVLFIKKKMS